MFENYIVAVNANYDLADKVLEDKVLKFVNPEEINIYKEELKKINKKSKRWNQKELIQDLNPQS